MATTPMTTPVRIPSLLPPLLQPVPVDVDPFLLPVHPAAAALPVLTVEEMRELTEDIRRNGLLEPLVAAWYNGGWVLVDGRHRRDGCKEVGIRPLLLGLSNDESIVEYIVAKNLRRRHLTASQRAMVGAELEPLFANEAKTRMLGGKRADPETGWSQGQPGVQASRAPQARALAAAAVGSSPQSVQRSKAVLRDGAPEVVQAVKQGELSVHAAQQLVALPKDTQVEIMAAASVEGASPTVVNRKVAAAMKGVAGRKTGPSPEDGAKGGGKPDIFGDVPELRSAADHLRAADEALSILLRGWEYASGDDVAVLMPIIRAIQRTIAPLAQQIADVTPAGLREVRRQGLRRVQTSRMVAAIAKAPDQRARSEEGDPRSSAHRNGPAAAEGTRRPVARQSADQGRTVDARRPQSHHQQEERQRLANGKTLQMTTESMDTLSEEQDGAHR